MSNELALVLLGVVTTFVFVVILYNWIKDLHGYDHTDERRPRF